MPVASSIERIHRPSREVFEREYLERGRPVLITGLMDDWEARRTWSDAYFREKLGDKRISVYRYDRERYDRYPPPQQVMTMREYLDAVQSDDTAARTLYLTGDFHGEFGFPELESAIKFPPYVDASRVVQPAVYIGRYSVTPCHYHTYTQAFFCMVSGRKRIVLYPPQDYRSLYLNPWYRPAEKGWYNFSRVDFDTPDPSASDRFPRLRRAHPIEVVVEPGEVVFIPVHWFHVVQGLEFNTSVTYFWHAPIRQWSPTWLSGRTFIRLVIEGRIRLWPARSSSRGA